MTGSPGGSWVALAVDLVVAPALPVALLEALGLLEVLALLEDLALLGDLDLLWALVAGTLGALGLVTAAIGR